MRYTILLILSSLSCLAVVDFNEEIRPIFNTRCITCHGGVKRAGGFGVAHRSQALEKTEHGNYAIVPYKPEESYIFKMIKDNPATGRPDMPQDRKPLSKEEVDVIWQWVKEGANWGVHWAYIKPKQIELPKVSNTRWLANPIDNFVLSNLDNLGLKPSPMADRASLLRRVSLDLTGFPPTVEEIQAFTNDKSEGAYERVVDRLLNSFSFGERWASLWLDLSRYADSKGHGTDRHRDMWLYRDYLIESFNEDKPFDQFTIEQLAGDLIPEPTREQLIATAFHRNTQNNDEGGTNDEEFRVAAVVDRVNTTGSVWMGASLECVQCHSHPYDPFDYNEYYEVMAFFNNSQDNDRGNEEPFYKTYSTENKIKGKQIEKDLKEAFSILYEKACKDESVYNIIKKESDSYKQIIENSWTTETDVTVDSLRGAKYMKQSDGRFLQVGDNPPGDIVTSSINATSVKEVFAIRLNIYPHKSMTDGRYSKGDDGDISVSTMVLNVIRANGKNEKVSILRRLSSTERPGFEIHQSAGNNTTTAWALGDPSSGDAYAVIVPKAPVKLKPGDKLQLVFKHLYQYANANSIGCFDVSTTTVKQVRDKMARSSIVAYKQLKGQLLDEKGQLDKDIFQFYLDRKLILADLSKNYYKLKGDLGKISDSSVLVLRDYPMGGQSRVTKVFNRGNWLSLGEVVQPDVPKSLSPFKPEYPRNRLGFAKWLVDGENPLTARVVVNRYWEQLFGLGIVETLEDFGSIGGTPKYYVELLDWLAVEFSQKLKWSSKDLLKMMVMSSTYRQDSAISKDLLEMDPRNRIYARGPRFRMTAEQIRDQSLLVSGLLHSKQYGKSVMPYQPDGVWDYNYVNSSNKWKPVEGPEKYSRALYTYWKRSSPYPSLMLFDMSNRNVCQTKRTRTNTPLQAFVTLNDPAFVDTMVAFGKVMMEHKSDDMDKLAYGFNSVVSREPEAAELNDLSQLYDEMLKHYQEHPEELKLLTKQDGQPALGAYSIVASVLLNLDEALTKR